MVVVNSEPIVSRSPTTLPRGDPEAFQKYFLLVWGDIALVGYIGSFLCEWDRFALDCVKRYGDYFFWFLMRSPRDPSIGWIKASTGVYKATYCTIGTQLEFEHENKDKYKEHWRDSKRIVLTGSKIDVKVEHTSRIVGFNVQGNQVIVRVEPYVAVKNVNIIGNNLTVIFRTSKFHKNLNICDNNSLIIL